MNLVVISPEHDDPRERAVMAELFQTAATRYHVRKPGISRAALAEWIERLPRDWRRRLVLHQHHDLGDELGLGGRHWRDDGVGREPARACGWTSRSTHEVAALRASLGRYDSVFFGPVFASLSKPGYGPAKKLEDIAAMLKVRTRAERSTEILAIGGISATTIPAARELGFDGVAALGAVWHAGDPVAAVAALAAACAARAQMPRHPIMCLTQDGLPLAHVEQARRLCEVGARWIQLRMKQADASECERTAREVVAICGDHDVVCIVNDRVEIAEAVGADGVHLGRLDLDWATARRRLGGGFILGGTVNDAADAARAREAGVLDYVGVGPLRFTTTKQKLAPVLGLEGIRSLIAQLEGLPAWAIGGVTAADLPDLAAAGAAGAAVSGALFRDGAIEENFQSLTWPAAVGAANLA